MNCSSSVPFVLFSIFINQSCTIDIDLSLFVIIYLSLFGFACDGGSSGLPGDILPI